MASDYTTEAKMENKDRGAAMRAAGFTEAEIEAHFARQAALENDPEWQAQMEREMREEQAFERRAL